MNKAYSEQYDAYYDSITKQWLEPVCNEQDCEFCANRPPTAENETNHL